MPESKVTSDDSSEESRTQKIDQKDQSGQKKSFASTPWYPVVSELPSEVALVDGISGNYVGSPTKRQKAMCTPTIVALRASLL